MSHTKPAPRAALTLATILLGGLAGTSMVLAQAAPMSDADIQSLTTAAKAEGTFTIYSGQSEETLQQYVDAFEKATGIHGQFVRATGNTATQRISAEEAGGGVQADVIGTSEDVWFDDNAKIFAPLSKSGLPSLANWPASSYNDTHIQQTLGTIGLQYNTSNVDAASLPKQWTELTDPKWKGRLLLTDPQGSANYTGWVVAMAKAHGNQYLQDIAKLDLTFVSSGATAAQQVAAGAKDINAPTLATFSTGLKGQGAPIDFFAPSNPTLANSFNYGLVANSPHPNAGKLFMNWLLSDEGIDIACHASQVSSPRFPQGDHGCEAMPSDIQLVPYGITADQTGPLFDALGVK
ncbi:MAG TPA: extracellular solute-binding protein [Devosiaceae bacterium]|jgi:iron(III) transport system substrate-binding protein